MLHVACCLWDANEHSQKFSQCYNEQWVEKLYRGFRRNLTDPFRFVCFTDRKRSFGAGIAQRKLCSPVINYGCCIEPFSLNEPMIFAGLDTVITGNLDHMAFYCLSADKIALPRDPYKPDRSINAVALVPAGHRSVFDDWRGENDMEWLRQRPWQPIDDLWPGQVLSLKFHEVRTKGVQDARIIYYHGSPKPNDLMNLDWMKAHWR